MAKGFGSGRGGRSSSSGGGASGGGASAARLHQKSGSGNSFGGYTKVNLGGGNFTMRPTGKSSRGS